MLSMLHVAVDLGKVGNNKTQLGSSQACLVGSFGRGSIQRLSQIVCFESSTMQARCKDSVIGLWVSLAEQESLMNLFRSFPSLPEMLMLYPRSSLNAALIGKGGYTSMFFFRLNYVHNRKCTLVGSEMRACNTSWGSSSGLGHISSNI